MKSILLVLSLLITITSTYAKGEQKLSLEHRKKITERILQVIAEETSSECQTDQITMDGRTSRISSMGVSIAYIPVISGYKTKCGSVLIKERYLGPEEKNFNKLIIDFDSNYQPINTEIK